MGISFAFGNSGDSGKIENAKTIKLVQDGQKLTFTIDKLFENNYLDLYIPVKVEADHLTGQFSPVFQNRAIITSVGGREYEITSETTYHKTEIPVNVAIKKVWDGNNPNRPESVTVSLYGNDEIIGELIQLNKENNWVARWENLPYSDESGKRIEYSAKEEAVDDYITVIEDEIDSETGELVFKVINKFKTTNRKVVKTWDDNNDSRGKRPEKIKVQLVQNLQNYGEPVELSEENNWEHIWNNLPLTVGNEYYKYTIKEFPVEGYSTTVEEKVDEENQGLYFDITNKYKTTSRYVRKVWDDNDNILGLRPSKVMVQLLANGNNHGDIIELSDENNWYYEWNDLEIMDGNIPIEYSVVEDFVNDYRAEVKSVFANNDDESESSYGSGQSSIQEELIISLENGQLHGSSQVEGFIITNILDFTERSAVKLWVDDDNKDGKRPDSITLQLLRDGIAYGDSVTLNEENKWFYQWTNLPMKNGQIFYDYNIEEVPVENYESKVEIVYQLGEEGEEVNDESTERVYVLTNTYIKPIVPEDLTSITANKIWVGGPSSKPTIELQLLRNGEKFGDSIELANGNRSHTWKDLATKDDEGNDYYYTIDEINVPIGYSSRKLSGELTIVNVWQGTGSDLSPNYPDTDKPESPHYPESNTVGTWSSDTDKPYSTDISEAPAIQEAETTGNNDGITTNETAPVSVKDKDKPSIIPRTGDDSKVYIYGFVLLIAAVLLIRILFKRAKNDEK
ncbi:MAG: Cna B-type domain-containing protein [Tissierellia bacterium]|nr:Cna B-type domain-containing protein [Tissierellia bacterium]